MTITSLVLVLRLSASAPAALPSDVHQAPSTASPAQAGAADARWQPWLGCWQLVEERVDDGSAALARLLGVPAPTTDANRGALVCVTAAGATGATLTTRAGGRPQLTETIVPDGTNRPLAEPDCQGWQRAEWSALGARVYATAEVACARQARRRVSGLSLVVAGPNWIDIQMIEGEGLRSLRVRRYRPAADQRGIGGARTAAREPAVQPLAARFSIADVKEASEKVAAEALQAALVEIGSGFDLDGRRLVELAEAGVPRGVIDLMVALSFPERFVVERSRPAAGSPSPMDLAGFDDLWPFLTWPYLYPPYAWPYYSRYDPYFYSSYYAPFGYRYWGYYDPFYFTGPGFVVLDPGSRPPSPQPSGEGRVVDGLGYTRVRRQQPEPTVSGGEGGWSSASGGRGGGGSSGSGGSSGGVSSGGYSSGGSGGGGGRTAQPRPPGDR